MDLKVVVACLALLALVSGRVLETEPIVRIGQTEKGVLHNEHQHTGQQPMATLPPDQSLVDTWPTDMVVRVGQEGRINFTLKAGKAFDRVSTRAVFIGKSQLETIYQATSTKEIILPEFKQDFEIIPGSKHDLKIKSMVWTLAGTYMVTATDPDLINEDHQFTVGAINEAKCSVSKTEDVVVGEVVNMDCSAEHTEYKAPIMKWKDAKGEEIPGSVVPADDYDGKIPLPKSTVPKKALYRASVTATPEHDGSLFKCSLSFEDPITYTDECTTSFKLRVTGDTILPIPPIAGVVGLPLNISCEATLTSGMEGIRMKKMLETGARTTIVTLMPPTFDQPPSDTAKYQLTKTSLHGFYITIKDVVFEDAARYQCSFIVQDSINKLTTVVIVRKPNIHVMDTIPAGKITEITCDADYQVPFDLDETTEYNKFPQIAASIGGELLSGGTKVRTKTNIKMSWNVTLQVADDKKDLVCKVFTVMPEHEQTATKVLNVIGDNGDTIVSRWPTDMAVRVGKEGMVNFRLLPGKRFMLLSLKAMFEGTSVLQTIYQATESSAVVQPDFVDVVEKVPGSPHDLVAKVMPWSGAGEYLAQVTHTDLKQEQRTFKMVVVNQVQCSLSKSDDIKEGDVVSMDCSAEYTGDKAPTMKWQNEKGKDIQGFVMKTPDYSGEKVSLTTVRKVVYRANVTVSCDCPWRLYKCRLSFGAPITYTDSCNTWFGVQ